MPGHLYFCAEWRRLRKVLAIEEDLLYDFVFAAPSWDNVPVDSSCEFVKTNQLQGWTVEIEQDLFDRIREDFLAESSEARSPRGRSAVRDRSPRRSPQGSSSPRRVCSPSARSPTPSRIVTRSPTLRSFQAQSAGPTRPILFKNPWHPLANLPEALGRADFVAELRKRLRAPRLFEMEGLGCQSQGEPLFSPEECEDLFEVLLQLQKIAEISHPNATHHVAFGWHMDATVDAFYQIYTLRAAVERGAPSLNAFLQALQAKDSTLVDATLLRQFLQMVNYRLELQAVEASDLMPVEMIVKAHSGIEVEEFRRRLSFAAPVGVSINEVYGHLEVKHGFGRAKLPGFLDCAQLGEHFCGVEHLDISLLDLSRFCRFWSAGESHLPPPLLEQALTRLPLEADWALEPFLAEQSFNALGLRCLQVERHKRRHACLPPQAVLEVRSDDEKAEATLPTEKVLHERFEVLWTQCLGEGKSMALLPGKDKTEKAEKDKAESQKTGTFKELSEKEMAATQQMKEACLARYIMSARALAQQPVSRRQYESIFPNISDILAVSSVNLRAGQVVVVRYRLAGACNFWHPKHRVLKDEREPLPWPVPSKVRRRFRISARMENALLPRTGMDQGKPTKLLSLPPFLSFPVARCRGHKMLRRSSLALAAANQDEEHASKNSLPGLIKQNNPSHCRCDIVQVWTQKT
ncbi:unnamed protein product [Durusdinium trenchii]|uniref:Uncharacterized protein n=1 Tax=Durusdinium trenchii TaxID=1381693 RepID=A0ABP0JTH6_9DINO